MPQDLTGIKFGKLTAVRLEKSRMGNKKNARFWLCRCECGQERVVQQMCLTGKEIRSCGCTMNNVVFDADIDQTIREFYEDLGPEETAIRIRKIHGVEISSMRVRRRAVTLQSRKGKPGRTPGTQDRYKPTADEMLWRGSITHNAFLCQPWGRERRYVATTYSCEVAYHAREKLHRADDYYQVAHRRSVFASSLILDRSAGGTQTST